MHHHNHHGHNRAEDDEGVDVVLRILRAAVGNLIEQRDQAVQHEAEEDGEDDLLRGRGLQLGAGGEKGIDDTVAIGDGLGLGSEEGEEHSKCGQGG